jgi:XapX domain-containing protein
MNWKLLIGIALSFGIGLGCRAFGIPSPAPPVLVGALLVLAMTIGYVLADKFLARRSAIHSTNCGGPTGESKNGMPL